MKPKPMRFPEGVNPTFPKSGCDAGKPDLEAELARRKRQFYEVFPEYDPARLRRRRERLESWIVFAVAILIGPFVMAGACLFREKGAHITWTK